MDKTGLHRCAAQYIYNTNTAFISRHVRPAAKLGIGTIQYIRSTADFLAESPPACSRWRLQTNPLRDTTSDYASMSFLQAPMLHCGQICAQSRLTKLRLISACIIAPQSCSKAQARKLMYNFTQLQCDFGNILMHETSALELGRSYVGTVEFASGIQANGVNKFIIAEAIHKVFQSSH